MPAPALHATVNVPPAGRLVTVSARDSGRDEAALALLRSSCPAPSDLVLKVGAQVILTKTLNSEERLVNGARGGVHARPETVPQFTCRG